MTSQDLEIFRNRPFTISWDKRGYTEPSRKSSELKFRVKYAGKGIAAKRDGVKSVGEKFILDLFELRLSTAPTAAAFAAMRRSQPHLDRMNRALIVADEGTLATERGRQADIDFHDAILQAANNELLYLLSSSIGAAVTWSTLINRELSPLGATRPVSTAWYSTRLPRAMNTYRPNLGVPKLAWTQDGCPVAT